ncbi:MAG: diacylglycerol kinase family protein, partial [Limosilactobacillus mucosae]
QVLVIIVAFLMQVNVFEWLWLLSAIFVVFAVEFANTIVEELVDLVVHHHYDLDAKYAKDIAAGVVLLAAFYAVLVGLLIFWPRFKNLLGI